MIYQTAEQKAEDMFQFFSKSDSTFRMAVVTEIVSERPKIRFFGETKPAEKLYKFLSGYQAQEDDVVILARIGNTYVILGKVE